VNKWLETMHRCWVFHV